MLFQSVAVGLAVLCGAVSALDKPLDVQRTHPVECADSEKSKAGDNIEVHYRGTLEDGTEFDASYNRGSPLTFAVGRGQVIKGWDEGFLGVCAGEKRKLTIQPEWAYGARSMGPIKANSVLIFETELVSINGKGAAASKEEL